MPNLQIGFVYAFSAAVTHTLIDVFRKAGSKRIDTLQLVCLVAILDCIIIVSFTVGQGGFKNLHLYTSNTFVFSVIASSLIRLVSGAMYQKALQVSPISMTVPYLSFTPAILVLVGYVVLNEVPSSQGVVGLVIVTSAGFLLSFENARNVPTMNDSLKSMNSKKQEDQKRRQRSDQQGSFHNKQLSFPLEDGLISSDQIPSQASPHTPTHTYDTNKDGISISGDCDGGGSNQRYQIQMLKSSPPLTPTHARTHTHHSASGDMRGSVGGMKNDVESQGYEGGIGKQQSGALMMGKKSQSLLFDKMMLITQEKGTLLMIGVAALWSFTSSLDKLGASQVHSFLIYLALQRICMAIPCFFYLLAVRPKTFGYIFSEFPMLFGISFSEALTVIFHILSMQTLLVSYAVAAKRCGILLSVLVGGIFFGESILRKIPYIILMMVGMLTIIFAPDHHEKMRHLL